VSRSESHGYFDSDAKEREQRWLHQRYPELADGSEKPQGDLGLVKLEFARMYARWELSLPDDAVERRESGQIRERGWGIYYRFGSDEDGEFLIVFARHRMTNDRLFRMRESGGVELIGASQDLFANANDEARTEEARFRDLVQEHGF